MVKPIVLDNGSLVFDYDELRITIGKIRNGQRGGVTGELELESPPGVQFITPTLINLLDHNERFRLAEQSNRQADTEQTFRNYYAAIEDAAIMAVTWYRQGEPSILIPNQIPDFSSRLYLIHPIIEYEHITTIFAEGGSGKSLIGALLSVLVTHGCRNNLNFVPLLGNVLYLDWESTKEVLHRRIYALKTGLGIETTSSEYDIVYRRCNAPLVHDIDAIQELCLEHCPALLVIDSQLAATTGDTDKSEGATLFFNTIRSFNTTALILDHTPKGQKTIYGSVTKFNRSRSVFLIETEQEPGDDELIISLQHIKNNDGPKLKPMGIKFEFTNDEHNNAHEIKINKADLSLTMKLDQTRTIKDRLYSALLYGTATVKELAEEFSDSTEGSIRDCLNKNKETFLKLENGKWGILSHGV
jgi:hypothetical protein